MKDAEREMLLADTGPAVPRRRRRRTRSRARKLMLVAAGALLALVLVVAVAGPTIAAAFAPSEITVTIAGQTARLRISDLDLSWSGPQRAGAVQLVDAGGAQMADITVEADTSLFAALWSKNLGLIQVSGDLDLRERQLTPPPGPARPPKSPTAAAAPRDPIPIPTDLRFTLRTSGLDLTYRPDGAPPVEFKNLDVDLIYDPSAEIVFKARTASPVLNVDLRARNIADRDGNLELHTAEIDLDSSAMLPGALIDALAAAAAPNPQPPTSASPTTTPAARLAIAAQMRAGRLTLRAPSSPLMAILPTPAPFVNAVEAGGDIAELSQPPVFTVAVTTLDIPIADILMGRPTDYRGSALNLTLRATESRALLRLAPDEAPRTLVIPTWQLALRADNFASQLTAGGELRVLINDAEAGRMTLAANVSEMLDDAGALRPVPGSAVVETKLDSVPVALFEPFAAATGVSLVDTLGPQATAEFSARTKRFNLAKPGTTPTPAPPGSIEVLAQVQSPLSDIWAVLVTDGARLWSEEVGARVELRRAGPAIRALLAERADLTIDGQGLLIAEAHDIDVPLINWAPDLSRAGASLRLAFGNLTLSGPALARPVQAVSLQTNLDIAPGPDASLAIDYRLRADAETTMAAGRLALPGLASRQTGGPPWIQFTPESARPVGRIDITDLPADILGLVPQPWGDALRAAAGSTLSGVIDFASESAGTPDAPINITLNLAGADARLDGAFTLADGRLTAARPLTFAAANPQPLAAALVRDNASVRALWRGPAHIELQRLSLPLGGDAPLLSGLTADLNISAGEASITAASAAPPIDVRRATLSARIAPGADPAIELDAQGAYAGEAFDARGHMSLPGLLSTSGELTPASARPVGEITLERVPGALASLVPSELSAIATELLGERFDFSITAPAPPPALASLAAADGPTFALALNAQRAELRSDIRLMGRDLAVGPTAASVHATPVLVEAAKNYLALEQPLPTLERPATLDITAQPIIVRLDENWSPDTRTLRPVQAMVTAGEDIYLGAVPIGPDSAPISLGLRDLTIGAAYTRERPLESEGSIRATLFDPADPRAPVANVNVVSNLVMPPPALQATLADIDTARLDRLLQRPGLTAEALGDQAGVSLVGATGGAGRPMQYDLTVVSPRLRARGALIERHDRFELVAPIHATWEAPADWLNRYALPQPEDPRRPATLAFTAPLPLTADVRTLSIGRSALFAPGAFALEASLTAPRAQFATAGGEHVTLEGLALATRSEQSPAAAVAFELSAQRQSIAAPGAAETRAQDPLTITGRLSEFADASGALALGGARLDARITGATPTAVLDALSDSQGLLVDLLGPTTRVEATADDLSRESGSIFAQAATEFASAQLTGAVEAGALHTTRPVSVELRRVTPNLSARVFETVIPILTRVEKTAQDKPATLRTANLTLPLNGDPALLNGTVTVDLGTVQFETSDLIGRLLKATGNRAAGSIGRSVKPFEFTITNGVIRYDRIELPMGEFEVVTRGEVDLVRKRIDIITFVPVLAVADEVLKVTKIVPGLVSIPIRTRGPFGQAKSEVALEHILEEGLPGAAGRGAEGIIQGVGSALEDLLGRKDREEKKAREEKENKKQQQQQEEQNDSKEKQKKKRQ